jgi:hypothetical protein
MLHALPSQAFTPIWMSVILKLFASDIIFANHNRRWICRAECQDDSEGVIAACSNISSCRTPRECIMKVRRNLQVCLIGGWICAEMEHTCLSRHSRYVSRRGKSLKQNKLHMYPIGMAIASDTAEG